MEAFFTVALKVTIMIIMMAVGWFITKRGTLTDKGAGEITKILLNIVTPCLIISSFINAEPGALSPFSLGLSVVTAVAAIGIAIGISLLFFRKTAKKEQVVLRFAIIFSNAGFMGIPLIQSIVGDGAIIYGSFFIATFNFFCWTYGYSMMSGGEKVSIKTVLLNPGTIGLAIGLPLYLLKISLPEVIASPITSFADLNTPLAMLVVGANIAKVKFKDFLTDKSVYIASFARLLIAPVLLIALLCIIRPEYDLFMSTSIQAAAPVAANCVLFAVMFGQDSKLASKVVAASTLMSVITIPCLTLFAQFLAGIVL